MYMILSVVVMWKRPVFDLLHDWAMTALTLSLKKQLSNRSVPGHVVMLSNLLLNMLYESIILWCCQWPNAWTFILFSSRVKLEVRVAGQVCWHSWSCFTLLTGPSAIPSPVIRLVKSDDLTAAWECQSCPPLATELFIKSGQATHFSFPR